jgi:hypothetical protein
MAGIQTYETLGTEVELYKRVKNSDPTNAIFEMLVLAQQSGLEVNDLLAYTTVAAMLADWDEVTNTGYSRITLDDTDLDPLPAVSGGARLLALPLVTFGSPDVDAGDVFDILVVAYDSDSTGGTDADKVPVSAHEMRINGTAVPGTGTAGIAFDLSGGWLLAR